MTQETTICESTEAKLASFTDVRHGQEGPTLFTVDKGRPEDPQKKTHP